MVNKCFICGDYSYEPRVTSSGYCFESCIEHLNDFHECSFSSKEHKEIREYEAMKAAATHDGDGQNAVYYQKKLRSLRKRAFKKDKEWFLKKRKEFEQAKLIEAEKVENKDDNHRKSGM